jgi:hypothetical protein
MRHSLASKLAGLPLLLFGAAVAAQEPRFKPIPPEKTAGAARLLAADLAEISDQLAGAPLAMVPDVDKAHGLYHSESGGGVIAVPVKGFDLGGTVAKGEAGIPVGYLFGSPPPGVEASSFRLITASGKPYAAGKRLFLSLKLPDAKDRREVEVLRLRLKRDGDGPGQLLVYTMDKEPALAVPLRKQASSSGLPISIGVKDVSERRLTLVVSLHDQYAADITVGRE